MQPYPLPSVLVVEDDPDLTELLRNVLAATHAVECVGDVPEALASLDQRQPNLVLLDCLLPGGGLGDMLARTRGLDCGVVLMSGLPEILTELAGLGYTALQKPFKIAELLIALESALPPETEPRDEPALGESV